jgi:hypothetical protein
MDHTQFFNFGTSDLLTLGERAVTAKDLKELILQLNEPSYENKTKLNLKHKALGGSEVVDLLCTLKHVTALQLAHNDFNGEDLQRLLLSKKFVSIDLSNNNIETDDITLILDKISKGELSVAHLQTLNVDNAQIAAACINKLKGLVGKPDKQQVTANSAKDPRINQENQVPPAGPVKHTL